MQDPTQRNHGHPAPDAGAGIDSICPVRFLATSTILSIPRHSVATMNNVFLLLPPSIHAKQPRSTRTVWSTSPPSRTRTQHLFGTSAYQTDCSASTQMPSGTPVPRSAQTRRFERLPPMSISKAVSFLRQPVDTRSNDVYTHKYGCKKSKCRGRDGALCP